MIKLLYTNRMLHLSVIWNQIHTVLSTIIIVTIFYFYHFVNNFKQLVTKCFCYRMLGIQISTTFSNLSHWGFCFLMTNKHNCRPGTWCQDHREPAHWGDVHVEDEELTRIFQPGHEEVWNDALHPHKFWKQDKGQDGSRGMHHPQTYWTFPSAIRERRGKL